MDTLKVIALTHKAIELDKIGEFHLDDTEKKARLTYLKEKANLKELMYLSTCNRVEFTFSSEEGMSYNFLREFFQAFNPKWNEEQIDFAAKNCIEHEGEFAVKHMFDVASSLDSLVIGEREIITQVRKAYEDSREMELTGDVIRMAVERTINAAKAVYTHSKIAANPVSVVSLAYRKLQEMNINDDSKILVVGAGKTNTSMLKFLHKRGIENYTIYNRSIKNAEKLAGMVDGKARVLTSLEDHKEHFDIIITCTGSADTIFTEEVYSKVLNGDTSSKTVVDLAIPNDFQRNLTEKYKVKLIAVEDLKKIAEKNLEERAKEIDACEAILSEQFEEYKKANRERKIEVAMRAVPQTVKEIKQKAYNEVFAKELGALDTDSKEVLDKVVAYLEKKYISVPMKMAREILIDSTK